MGNRIVIVGAGFAGLSAATAIPREYDVTVVSSHPWCEFLPNIHELVSGHKRAEDLRLDAAGRIESVGHRFLLERIVEIDLAGRRVRGDASGTHPFDALILAIGGENATHGVSGADRWSMPFKSVEDCARIGHHLRELDRDTHDARVTIVGGGLEGIEALGEILRAFPRFHVRLIEGGPRLLASGPESLDRTVRGESAPFDVRFSVDTRVREVRPDGVVTSGETHFPSDVVIWTGGPTGSQLLHEAGLTPLPGAWAPVAPTLESPIGQAVFVAGDAADLETKIAKQAYHAIDMGVCAAANAVRRLEGRALEPFVPAEKPMLVSFGHLGCFLVLGEWVLFGPALALAKEAVFQLVSAQLVPPLGYASAQGAWSRLSGALPVPGWPGLASTVRAIRGALDLRVFPPVEPGAPSRP